MKAAKWIGLGVMAWQLMACGKTEMSAAEHLQRAQQALAANDINAAVVDLKNVLTAEPSSKEGRMLLADIYLRLGEGEAAEKELDRAVAAGIKRQEILDRFVLAYFYQGDVDRVLSATLDPGVPKPAQATIHGLMAQIEFSAGKKDAAREHVEAALAIEGANPEGLLGQGQLLVVDGKLAEAKSLIEGLVQRAGEHMRARLLLGDVLAALGEPEAAIKTFEGVAARDQGVAVTRFGYLAQLAMIRLNLAKDDPAAAKALVEGLLAKKIATPDVYYYKGLIAFGEKQYEAASEALLSGLKLSEKHRPSLLLLGAVKHAQEQYLQADMYLSQYVAAEPGNIAGRKLLGDVKLRLNQPQSAYEAMLPALGTTGDDAELLEMIGRAALRKGDFAQGRAYLQQVLEKNPEAASLKLELAMASVAQGNPDAAIEDLTTLVQSGQGEFKAEQLLVVAYLQKKQPDKALESAKGYQARHQDDVMAYLLLSSVYQVTGDLANAESVINQGMQIAPEHEKVLFAKAQIAFRQGKTQDAKEHLERLLKSHPAFVPAYIALAEVEAGRGDNARALELLTTAAGKDQTAVPPRLLLGRYYLQTGELERAKQYVEDLKKIAPELDEVALLESEVQVRSNDLPAAEKLLTQLAEKRPQAQIYFNLALVQLRMDKTTAAKRSLQSALADNPKYLPALETLGRVALKENQVNEALKTAEKLTADYPNAAAGYVLKADVMLAQKRIKEAEPLLLTALSKQETTRDAIKLYEIREALGQKDAHRTLEQWLERHPKDTAAMIRLATGYQMQGQRDKAIEYLKKATGLDDKNYIALNNLAWLQYEKGDLDNARLNAKKAYELNSQNAGVLDTYGWVLYHQNAGQEAEEILYKARQLAGKTPEISYHYAVVLNKNGKKLQAKSILQELLDSKTEFPERSEAKKLLETL
ncbi:MAG: XrtA/PEP-CTERM system TPR-repeat protein PrsT [Pseudomonadota bacterium]